MATPFQANGVALLAATFLYSDLLSLVLFSFQQRYHEHVECQNAGYGFIVSARSLFFFCFQIKVELILLSLLSLFGQLGGGMLIRRMNKAFVSARWRNDFKKRNMTAKSQRNRL
ncbi:hypothetical protein, partial [Bacteroides timonensis]|uniref:hypothetical protein n=1 Tax=Bacteroides timonensis TaxID=1470345 RepID=UPI001ADF55FE